MESENKAENDSNYNMYFICSAICLLWVLDEWKWIRDRILPDLVCTGCIAWRMRSDYISGWMGKNSDVDVVDIKRNTARVCIFLCNYRRMHYSQMHAKADGNLDYIIVLGCTGESRWTE